MAARTALPTQEGPGAGARVPRARSLRRSPLTYTPRLPSRAHQVEAHRRREARPRRPSDADVFAYLMDMGTGKTKVVLDEWGERADAHDLSDLLITAPAGSYRNWDLDRGPTEPGEMTKHLDPALRERMVVAAWVSGGNAATQRQLEAVLRERERPRALVVNIEALSIVVKAREACREFLRTSRHGAMMAVDESTTIKGHDSKRTELALELGQMAVARRIMSGLVAPRDPLDLFSQFEFLDWRIFGSRSFYGFRNRYAVIKKMQVDRTPHPTIPGAFARPPIDVVVDFRNLEDLQARMAPYSYRCLKSECLDLEPKVYLPRDVPLTSEQLRIYKDLRRFATAKLSGERYVTATMVITQLIRLDQVLCGFTVDEEGREHAIPERRTEALLEVLEEHRGKAIIWCAYDYNIRAVAARLRKEYGPNSVSMFWGGNKSTRVREETVWKTDPERRFMVATAAAGGMGNNWTAADLSVYHSNDYDLEHRNQSEDRPHREGQTLPCTYVDLIARGTTDEKKVKSLRRKLDLFTTITGETWREWLI